MKLKNKIKRFLLRDTVSNKLFIILTSLVFASYFVYYLMDKYAEFYYKSKTEVVDIKQPVWLLLIIFLSFILSSNIIKRLK